FAEHVSWNHLERVAADAAHRVVRVRARVRPTARAAQCEHVMRETREVERLVQRERADGADRLTAGRGNATAETIAHRNAHLKTILGRDENGGRLIFRVARPDSERWIRERSELPGRIDARNEAGGMGDMRPVLATWSRRE